MSSVSGLAYGRASLALSRVTATVLVVATATPGTIINNTTVVPSGQWFGLIVSFIGVGFSNADAAVVTCTLQVVVNNVNMTTNPTYATFGFAQTLGATGTAGATTAPFTVSATIIPSDITITFPGLNFSSPTTIGLAAFASVANEVTVGLGAVEVDAVLQTTV